MGLSAERMSVGGLRYGGARGGDGGDAVAAGCWKWRFLGSCVSPRSKADGSISGSSTQQEECKSSSATDDASDDQPVALVVVPSIRDQPVAIHRVSKDKLVALDSGKEDNGAKSDSVTVAPVVEPPSTGHSGNTPSTPKVQEESLATPKVELELKIASQLRKFGFSELKSATRGFKQENLLGEGGFGCVYKGWISEHGPAPVKPGSGITVAVKTLNHDGLQGHKEWVAEVNYLGDLLHANLVKLIGYCIEDDQRLLVYEFMPRGSLENHLFRRSLPLPWFTRLKIALGAAKGLAFLHEEAEKPVIYRDFKTSNILLDTDYNTKLSDFGLAKDAPVGDQTHVSTRVMGTHGYAAPEYVMTGHLTSKSDVYSFGVVLLEILSGRRSMDKTRPPGLHNLVEWARPYLRERRRMFRLVDPRLEGRFSVTGALKAIELAAQCLSRDAKSRPLMSQVVEELKPLPDLKDMACSSPYYLALQNERPRTVTANGQQKLSHVRSVKH